MWYQTGSWASHKLSPWQRPTGRLTLRPNTSLCRSQTLASVDTSPLAAHIAGVSKKPRKVGEPTGPYTAKKTVKASARPSSASKDSQVRYIDPETARKLT